MAKIKPEKANEKITVTEFGGLRQVSSLAGCHSSIMRNFRIASDGSLEKRTGTKTLFDMGTRIRGLWQGSLDGKDYLVAVAGNYTYVRLPGSDELTQKNRLNTSTGKVSFAVYRQTLLLFDGNSVYRFATSINTFIFTYGYAPLYGDGWHPIQKGPVNEQLNALSARIRIRYDNSVGSTEFFLPFAAQTINRVEVDGTVVTPTFTARTNTFTIPQQYAHGTLTVSLTLISSYDHREMVAELPYSFLYAGSRETLLVYGGASSCQLAYTAPVSDEQLAESNRFFSTSTEIPLYFPLDHFFSLADAAHPIHAVFRDRDRAIAMNDRFTWALEFSGDQLISYPLEGGIGCASSGGVAICGGHPVIVQAGGVFRLKFPSGESDVCVAESISQEITELIPASVLQNGILAWFPGRDELWLRDPLEGEEGLVWVYKRQRKEWYCFDGLFISDFYELDGTVGFTTINGKILLPDETSYTDSGTPITAAYLSHFFALSTPETTKRALRTTVCADTGGQQLLIITETDTRSRPFTVQSTEPGIPKFFEANINLGRFRFLRFALRLSGNSPARIYRLSILANR